MFGIANEWLEKFAHCFRFAALHAHFQFVFLPRRARFPTALSRLLADRHRIILDLSSRHRFVGTRKNDQRFATDAGHGCAGVAGAGAAVAGFFFAAAAAARFASTSAASIGWITW